MKPSIPNLPDVARSLLENVYRFIGRFVAYPSEHAHVAHALWIAHTHLMDAWESTPRIAFLSPEPGSGKTRALEITETLVPRPVEAINVTPAYLFRKVSDPEGPPTILYDEIDTLFGPKAKDNEEIRGISECRASARSYGWALRREGKAVLTEELPAYCAVALAGLGGLPDTILTRSVVIRMRRRAPTEHVEPYRRRVHAKEGYRLRDQTRHLGCTRQRRADQPLAGNAYRDRGPRCRCMGGPAGRGRRCWRGVAERARVSAVSLVSDAKAATPSLGVRLLADLRTVFADREAMLTTEIISALVAMEEAPWGDLKGKPIDARRLARYLSAYGVARKQVRVGDGNSKGYSRSDLHDPWTRYLGHPAMESETSETPETIDAAEAVREAREERLGMQGHFPAN